MSLRIKQAHDIIRAMKGTTGELSWSHFLLPNPSLPEVTPVVVPQARRSQRDEPKYEDEHMDVFHELGFLWPPTATALKELFKESSICDLPQRCQELVYLAHMKYSGPKDLVIGVPEFLDANSSMGRLRLASGSPWHRNVMPTVVGQMKPVVRVRSQDGSDTIRCISGMECMQIQGWDLTDYCDAEVAASEYRNSLLINLAGNAFNAFACGAAFAASIPMMDLENTSDIKLADLAPASPVIDIEDSGEANID